MNFLEILQAIVFRADNERKYMLALSMKLPTFSPADMPVLNNQQELEGDPISEIKPLTLTDKIAKFVTAPAGIDFSKNIKHAHPYLQAQWPHLLQTFREETGHDLFITCTWRSIECQKRLYAQGRTMPGKIVTQIDGITKMSQHNYYPSRALDLAVDLDPAVAKADVTWEDKYYLPLGKICDSLKLVSGTTWTFRDMPHVQVRRDMI